MCTLMLRSVYTDIERWSSSHPNARWGSLDKPSFRVRFTALQGPPGSSSRWLLSCLAFLRDSYSNRLEDFCLFLRWPSDLAHQLRGGWEWGGDCPKGWEAHGRIEVGTNMTQNLVWGAFQVFFYTQSKTMSTLIVGTFENRSVLGWAGTDHLTFLQTLPWMILKTLVSDCHVKRGKRELFKSADTTIVMWSPVKLLAREACACPVEEISTLFYCFWHFITNGKLFENGLERLMWTESFHAIFK